MGPLMFSDLLIQLDRNVLVRRIGLGRISDDESDWGGELGQKLVL